MIVDRPQIYLHIGPGKTGSSALQFFLLKNEELLKKQGVLYPKHQVDINGISGGHGKFLGKAKKREKFKKYINNQKGIDKVILSWEGMFMHPREMYELFPEVQGIVFYLRKQDQWLESVYNQEVKRSNETRSFEEFVENYLNNNPSFAKTYLDEWVALYGQDKLIIKPYDLNRLYQKSLVLDFLKTLEIEVNEEFSHSNKLVNIGYTKAALFLKKEINELPKVSYYFDACLQHYSAFCEETWSYRLCSPKMSDVINCAYEKEYAELEGLIEKYHFKTNEFSIARNNEWKKYNGVTMNEVMNFILFLCKEYPQQYKLLIKYVDSFSPNSKIKEALVYLKPLINFKSLKFNR